MEKSENLEIKIGMDRKNRNNALEISNESSALIIPATVVGGMIDFSIAFWL